MSHMVRVSDSAFEKMRREKPAGMTAGKYFDLLVENQSRAMEVQRDVQEKLRIILDMLSEKNETFFSEKTKNNLSERTDDVFAELFSGREEDGHGRSGND